MKRLFTLSLVFVMAVASSYSQLYQGGWAMGGFNPFGTMPEKAEVTAIDLKDSGWDYLLPGAFDELWNQAIAANKGRLDSLNAGQTWESANRGAADFDGEFVAAYDADYLYVLVKIADDHKIGTPLNVKRNDTQFETKRDEFELMFASYPYAQPDVLADTAGSGSLKTTRQPYGRWSKMGAIKTGNLLTGDATTLDFSVIYTGDYSDFTASTLYAANPNWTAGIMDGGDVVVDSIDGGYEVIIAYDLASAFVGNQYSEGGLLAEPAKFELAGIDTLFSLDFQFLDIDSIAGQTVHERTSFHYSATNNDVYCAVWYAGLVRVTYVSAVQDVRAASQISAKLVGNELRISQNAKNVVITNMVGQVVKRAANVDKVDVSNLRKGTYVATINGVSSVKFVK